MTDVKDEKTIIPPEEGEPKVDPIIPPEEGEPKVDEKSTTVVTFDEGEGKTEPEPEPAPKWVKELRKDHRRLKKENSKLQDELNKNKVSETPTLGAKPTLESCEFDNTVYEQKMEKYITDKAAISNQKTSVRQQEESQAQEWKERLKFVDKCIEELDVEDFEEAKDIVETTLTTIQMGLVVEGADNPAIVLYALGKYPNKAKELAAIKSHVKFVAELSKMESKMKVEKRSPSVKPESSPKSSASTSTANQELDKLREEAAKTGDFTKIHEYKRKMKQLGKL